MLRALLVLVVLGLAAVGGFAGWAMRHPALAPLASPPKPESFDKALVEKGELAPPPWAIARSATRGRAAEISAGGFALPTPFGTIYSTNITPDPETGIGNWSEEAFRRAMHQGVDREGRYLYPAFPYDHFTRVTDEDIKAIYAYLMTQKPVRYTAPQNQLDFPFNIRLLVARWNLLFLEEGRFKPDPSKDEAWNRGAYLAEGLGHCGSCHTPRNKLGGLDNSRKFGGGDIEGWHGTALGATSPAPVPWTKDSLLEYFIEGRDKQHGIAAGPMTPVVNLLSDQSDADLDGLATYIASFHDRKGVDGKAAIAFAEQRQLTNAPGAPQPMSIPRSSPGSPSSCTVLRINCHRKGEKAAPLGLASTITDPIRATRSRSSTAASGRRVTCVTSPSEPWLDVRPGPCERRHIHARPFHAEAALAECDGGDPGGALPAQALSLPASALPRGGADASRLSARRPAGTAPASARCAGWCRTCCSCRRTCCSRWRSRRVR